MPLERIPLVFSAAKEIKIKAGLSGTRTTQINMYNLLNFSTELVYTQYWTKTSDYTHH